jgi:acyl-CoA synthetase (AMP-forming)/AMP-acid ligase II
VGPGADTPVAILRGRARAEPSRPVLGYLLEDGGDGIAFSVGDLDRAARAVAAALSDLARGERALLLYPPGPEFAAAFFGCLYAGVIPVPLPPPRPHRAERQAPRVARDCAPAVILTESGSAHAVARAWPDRSGPPIRVTGCRPTAEGDAWDGALPGIDDPALLQYTSGTTGEPRGVLVTHGNLAANIAAIASALAITPADTMVSWLPHHHDMGLIGTLTAPVAIGGRVVLLSPLDMLRRPVRWLRALTRVRATITGGPPFGYERCLSRVAPEEREGLDLSACRLAFVGAEPIRAGLLDRFCATYAPYGFRREAFYPCYGLAEATLFAAGGTAGAGYVRVPPDTVSCGTVAPGHRLAVVDPDTLRPLPQGEEGEIWLSGPSVAAGYWGRAHETAATFRATIADGDGTPFLRTGDLGRQGPEGLALTARLKDMIIVAGRNHRAEDLERSAQAACPELRDGIAAFPVALGDCEALALAIEAPDSEALRTRLREAMAAEHDLGIAGLLFVPAGRLPRTTSGKISRKGCQALYLTRGAAGATASAAALVEP